MEGIKPKPSKRRTKIKVARKRKEVRVLPKGAKDLPKKISMIGFMI